MQLKQLGNHMDLQVHISSYMLQFRCFCKQSFCWLLLLHIFELRQLGNRMELVVVLEVVEVVRIFFDKLQFRYFCI